MSRPLYVTILASHTEDEGIVSLGEVQFHGSWDEARETAFQRLLEALDTDAGDDEGPTLEDLEAWFPADEPCDFDLEHTSSEGSWQVALRAIP